MSVGGRHRPVIVVGAGPAGLSCALALRAHDVPVTVLESQPADSPTPGSRAIYIHGTTLRSLESVFPGLGRELARLGIVWSTKRTFWRGREVFARTYPPPAHDALPPFSSLPQRRIEEALTTACVAAGVEIVWERGVAAVTAGADGAALRDTSGTVWTARYVIGADGARSVVRRELGITMHGSRSHNSYVIVDVATDPGDALPLERAFHYEHPAVGGRNVLLVPFAGGWRVDLQCRDDDDPETFSGERAAGWVASVMGTRAPIRIDWVSTYQFLQVVATTLTAANRRVLLVGEAGHLFAPFGARGLNSGVADAMAAASAIRAALDADHAAAEAAAIDDFARSRLAAAHRNRRAAARALAATESGHVWHVARRRIAGLLAPQVRPAAVWLDSAPYGPRLRRPRPGTPASGY